VAWAIPVVRVDNPDVTVSKVYLGKRRGPGRPPKWVARVLDQQVGEEPPTGVEESSEGEEHSKIQGELTDFPDCEELFARTEKQPAGSDAGSSKPPNRYPLRSRSGRASVVEGGDVTVLN
jgi:hypothetical protein